MKDGYIQQVDTPLNLYNHPKNIFVAGFIGSPSMNFLKVKLLNEDGRLWLVNPAMRLPPIEERREALSPYIGKDIVLGIRPEAIYDDAHYLEAHPDWNIDVKVDVVEPMGSENYVYFGINGENVIARVESTSPAKVMQQHKVAFDMSLARFFDPETQEVIHRPGYEANY